MAGLETTFKDLIDHLKENAEWLEYGYSQFYINLEEDISTVQKQGEYLAGQIHSTAADIDKTDYESNEGFQGAWEQIPDVNF